MAYGHYTDYRMGNCQNSSLSDVIKPTLQNRGRVARLVITNHVWEKDYQGLFDFSSRDIQSNSIEIIQPGILVKGEQMGLVQPHFANSDPLSIFQVFQSTNYFLIKPIQPPDNQTPEKPLWLVVKSLPTHTYALRERDVIKLGKQRVRVREMVFRDKRVSKEIDFNQIIVQRRTYESISKKEEIVGANGANEIESVQTEDQHSCRICLQVGETSNPLICPCKCTGSVRYIHLKCLRIWLGKQLVIERGKASIKLKWKPLMCEMCKSHYSYRIYLDNKKYYTVQIPKPAKPYLVLEVLKRGTDYSKIYHFFSFAEIPRLSLGRKKEIDLKISDDVSVSRHHATISFFNNQFFVQDSDSKFGTLILLKRNLLITPQTKNICVQAGADLYSFEAFREKGVIQDFMEYPNYVDHDEGEDEQISEEEEGDYEEDDEEVE